MKFQNIDGMFRDNELESESTHKKFLFVDIKLLPTQNEGR